MGQSSSTQRDQRYDTSPDLQTSSHERRRQLLRDETMNERRDFEQTGEPGPYSGSDMNDGGLHGSPPSQLNPAAPEWQPTNVQAREQPVDGTSMDNNTHTNGTHYEPDQREHRSAIFARMAARRQSTMSRLGSRILPNSVIRGLLSSEEETPAEGHAHRHGIVSRTIPRSEVAHSSSRFNPLASLGASGISRRRRSARGPYFIPRSEPGLIPDTHAEHGSDAARGSWRRSARLHRVRNSLSGPIAQMFGQPSGQAGNMQEPAPLGSMPAYTPFLPHPGPMDTRMDFDEPHELDSVEPAIGATRPASPMSSHSTQGPAGLRQFPSLLRARPTRSLQREEQTPLSRVLQLAATAIAAQLSGSAAPVMPNIQSLGNDGLDGSLENFIQSLQHATSAQTSPNETSATPSENGTAAPVNFLRVFRFANSDSPRPSGLNRTSTESEDPDNGTTDGTPTENPSNGPEGRTVTLVVVGVRSVPPGNGPPNGENVQPVGGHGLDALLRLPFLSPGNLARNEEAAPRIPSRTDGLPRFATHRPQAGQSNTMPPNEDMPHQQGIQSPSRRLSDVGSRGPPSLPSVLSESPPGPNPPPSTPAEPGLSAVSSGASTPSRRPSSASVMSPTPLPQLNENGPMQPTMEPADSSIPLSSAHRRHRSDSEFARHRDLGSGAVRRNGVVEPDNAPPPAGRSWLIYVVGTNLSENHPAFATPSLFTDNPTYEDMILLSSLLGPVKPPVASEQDLHSAGGLYRLVEYDGSLVAESADGAGTIPIPDGDRCLICLSDYEAAEELRQLTKCKHVFHRDCIDQWLTTGRNSCPLCRGQGVAETSNSNSDPMSSAPNNATAV
ncbi:RING finger protein [Aspergillus terreus]|uniref:RING finger protein n=1 Tax=Aspergillus terreus TaxID=33178 RepID=A0A5M3YM09_ASPTE|nr:hypothetical protein ATETN484_0001061900 [Aspergillus terreus]GFF12475.1 RING finger protein [Aspergillus terreus]